MDIPFLKNINFIALHCISIVTEQAGKKKKNKEKGKRPLLVSHAKPAKLQPGFPHATRSSC